jgi:hypothetical protein
VKTVAHWFNPCAFVLAPEGTFGTFHRNGLIGPGNWNFDTAIWRTFAITEGLKLDFRAEAFNVFNHIEIGNPAAAALSVFSGALNQSNPGVANVSSSAGLISSTAIGANQRIMQLALKLTF